MLALSVDQRTKAEGAARWQADGMRLATPLSLIILHLGPDPLHLLWSLFLFLI